MAAGVEVAPLSRLAAWPRTRPSSWQPETMCSQPGQAGHTGPTYASEIPEKSPCCAGGATGDVEKGGSSAVHPLLTELLWVSADGPRSACESSHVAGPRSAESSSRGDDPAQTQERAAAEHCDLRENRGQAGNHPRACRKLEPELGDPASGPGREGVRGRAGGEGATHVWKTVLPSRLSPVRAGGSCG